jgi:hypothetical protein|tara:strand:- start:1471 stop:2031 length:561 start_codon:yes stop_codon:yes gene_type:complete
MSEFNTSNLDQLSKNVISKMRNFYDISGNKIFNNNELLTLSKIPISYLSRNSISRHGLTTNLDKSMRISSDNCQVRLNYHLFQEGYLDYAEFVLFHEYIHCLGNFSHNKEFRILEGIWPNKKEMNILGKKLTKELQDCRSNWAWTCSKCGFIVKKSTRRFRNNYFHKECKGKLQNIPIIHPTILEH